MAEVLSQSQIDALLSSIGAGGGAEPEVVEEQKEEVAYKNYDFFSPKKYTKERIKLLKSIYENFARIATSQINSLFRVVSTVEVVGVEEQRYYEFTNALYESDVISMVRMKLPDNSKNPPAIMYISPQIMTAMMDRMLGGDGKTGDVDISYVYTDIEIALYEKIMKYFVSSTADVWSSHIPVKASLERMDEITAVFQDISVDETVAIIMLKIEMLGMSGIMNVCLPDTLLFNIFSIFDKLKISGDDEDTTARRNDREEIRARIDSSPLEVKAELANALLSLDDIYNLRVGDVIDLNKPKDSEVSIYVQDHKWFTGVLGVHNKNLAVRLEDRTTENKKTNQEEVLEVK